MIKHTHTESAIVNFAKLEERIEQVNHPKWNKAMAMRNLLHQLIADGGPTLIMATGGSKVIAYYLQSILEKLQIICETIEPRDYCYKEDKSKFANLIIISASGKTNGIEAALNDFQGNKYLICENEQDIDCRVIAWGNAIYDTEKSFISLAASLCPITLLLDSILSLNEDRINTERINSQIKALLHRSEDKINKIPNNFKYTSCIQIMSGYDTKIASQALESNLVEVGLCAPIIHDKGSFCHGRSNLLFQYPDSPLIYLAHQRTDLDKLLIDSLKGEYGNVLVMGTEDLKDNFYWKNYYLLLQMYYLSKKIADDKAIDLTQPEYNPRMVKKLYGYKGEM